MNPVIIIGAGAAGLSAAIELKRAGMDVLVLEARDRIGGRIFTARDPHCPIPVELGAEFVHGRSPHIWDLVAEANLAACDCAGQWFHLENGRLQPESGPGEGVDDVMQDLARSAREDRDETFAGFLARSTYSEHAKVWAAAYVEGFNAARQDVIGTASLAEDVRGAEAIGGDRSFRILNGYDALVDQWRKHLGGSLRLNAVVERIQWKPGKAAVYLQNGEELRCRNVVITVPLGVLQAPPGSAGAIRFDPAPGDVLAAASLLRFGQAVRVTLRFRERFWEQNQALDGAGFLLSQEPVFPTWWTQFPVRAPLMTGWSAGPKADGLLGKSQDEIAAAALRSLRRITGVDCGAPEAVYFHDWHADPFARGAYSYVPAGALPARRKLAQPVENTLFFAGEATDQEGHSATVHGAIASGQRAVRQILAKL